MCFPFSSAHPLYLVGIQHLQTSLSFSCFLNAAALSCGRDPVFNLQRPCFWLLFAEVFFISRREASSLVDVNPVAKEIACGSRLQSSSSSKHQLTGLHECFSSVCIDAIEALGLTSLFFPDLCIEGARHRTHVPSTSGCLSLLESDELTSSFETLVCTSVCSCWSVLTRRGRETLEKSRCAKLL